MEVSKDKSVAIECDCCGRIYDKAHVSPNGLELYNSVSHSHYKALVPGIKSREELVCTPKSKLPNIKCICGGYLDIDEAFECEDTRDIVFLEKLEELRRVITRKYFNKAKAECVTSYIDYTDEDYLNTFIIWCSDPSTAKEIFKKCADAYSASDAESNISLDYTAFKCVNKQYRVMIALDDEIGYIKYLDALIAKFEKEDKE